MALHTQCSPLPGQVAGHGGLLRDAARSRVYKPLSGARGAAEAAFYARVCRDGAGSPPASLMPRYFGTTRTPGGDDATRGDGGTPAEEGPAAYLVLEDLTAGCRQPCVMDLKMGVQSWDEDAPPAKVASERGKWPPQASLGFRMTGSRAWRRGGAASAGGSWLERGREYAYALTPAALPAAFLEFVARADGGGVRLDVVARFVARLREVRAYFAAQSESRFYGSSLLFVYDGDADGGGCAHDAPVADVRMIDFAHVWPIAAGSGGRDEGYLLGIDTVLGVLKGLLASGGSAPPSAALPLPQLSWDGDAAVVREERAAGGVPARARAEGAAHAGAAAAEPAVAAVARAAAAAVAVGPAASTPAGAAAASSGAAATPVLPPVPPRTTLDHVPLSAWETVYEPAEDSWLLCDALAAHLGRITADGCPGLVVEIGCAVWEGGGTIPRTVLLASHSRATLSHPSSPPFTAAGVAT